MTRPPALTAMALLALAIPLEAQDPEQRLGTVHFPVSCSAEAQAGFNHALALLHHMTYPQARAAFERVAALDSACAMAHWGVAMTLFQPLWPTRPRPAELRRGWEEVQRARALEPGTARERSFIEAAAAFFEGPGGSDYWLRIRRWEAAEARTYEAFREDDEAAAFYALALLATAPSDSVSRTHADRAAALLVRIYRKNPDHPGAMHYLVHANDMPGRERDHPEIVSRYDSTAPRNPHALHMPTHIYTRMGDWARVVTGNRLAAAAALEHPAGPDGRFIWDEYPHAIEYLIYAWLQQARDDSAAVWLERLATTERLEPTFKTAFHLASTAARYVLERRAWTEAGRLVPRTPAGLDWDRFTWPEAIVEFARGLGAAHQRDLPAAEAALARLSALHTATVRAGERLFSRQIQVLELELQAWTAHARRDRGSALADMLDAVALEAETPKHAVTPGPTLPAPEMLGDMLMEMELPMEALVAYARSLALYPRRFNSLLGAARAARAAGDADLARKYYEELLAVAGRGARPSAITEAWAFVVRRE